MWLLLVWISVATIGLVMSLFGLLDSIKVTRFLKSDPSTRNLVGQFQIEVFRDIVAATVQFTNLSIGLLAVFTLGHANNVTGILSVVGLMLVAVLLTLLSAVNYIIRHRRIS
jgi:hypothetical protein